MKFKSKMKRALLSFAALFLTSVMVFSSGLDSEKQISNTVTKSADMNFSFSVDDTSGAGNTITATKGTGETVVPGRIEIETETIVTFTVALKPYHRIEGWYNYGVKIPGSYYANPFSVTLDPNDPQDYDIVCLVHPTQVTVSHNHCCRSWCGLG